MRGQIYRGNRPHPTSDHAITGVVGMIRFGTGTSPHLYFALGDLLSARGDQHLAARAYRRALDLGHPRPDTLRDLVRNRVSESDLRRERADAERWVAGYQAFEDGLVRSGKETLTEADYAPFYRKRGTAREVPSDAAMAVNGFVKLLQVNPVLTLIVGAFVLLITVRFTTDACRRRRARAAVERFDEAAGA